MKGPLASVAPAAGPSVRPPGPLSAWLGPGGPQGLGLGEASSSRLLAMGVALPALTLGVEWSSHWFGGIFFDPIPSLGHVALVAAVPASNAAVWWQGQGGRSEKGPMLHWLNGLGLAVAGYYSLLFLPLMPLAAVAILCGGIGLLGLAPAFALAEACVLWRALRRAPAFAASCGRHRWHGFLCGAALLTAAGAPRAVTGYGLRLAASDSLARQRAGVRLLRLAGDREWLLRACYRRQGRALDPLSLLVPALAGGAEPTLEVARQAYFRVTGAPFNSVPPPSLSGAPTVNPLAELDFDPEQGGTAVSGRLRGLSLADSRLDGSLDPDAGLGYLEWTLEFANSAPVEREARALLELPPGAVVSRATLWVGGEPREAVLASRAKAREAYQGVVRARRDPLLVTTKGPGRVLVQCFPVPPGGRMKVRLGVTAPLGLEDRAHATLRLPHFAERNFGLGREHQVWLESERPLHAPGLAAESPKPGLHALRGEAPDRWLSGSGAVLLERRPEVGSVWTQDTLGAGFALVAGELRASAAAPPGRLVVVLDGSAPLRAHLPDLAEALPLIPAGVEVAALYAGDEVVELAGPAPASAGSLAGLARSLRSLRPAGGRDNVPALARAWDLAAERPGGVVLWLHGPQPVLLTETAPLRQRWERRPDGPKLVAYSVQAGPDRVLEELDGLPVDLRARRDGTGADLARLFSSWRPGAESLGWELRRTRGPLKSIPERTSEHLARLWAHERIQALSGQGPAARAEALALALRYRLVTPVSGAVVLETVQQYRDAGLEPLEAGQLPAVPTVPEPETWVLALSALALAAWALWKPERPAPGAALA